MRGVFILIGLIALVVSFRLPLPEPDGALVGVQMNTRPAAIAPVAHAVQAVVAAPGDGVYQSHVLPLAGHRVYSNLTIQRNLIDSYTVSPGLRSGVIRPGERWSIAEQWQLSPAQMVTEYGVLGAGFCDLAATYADVAIQAGLDVRFTDHAPIDLAYAPAYANVAIWVTPGQAGGTDLTIINTTDRAWYYQAIVGDTYQVQGWFE